MSRDHPRPDFPGGGAGPRMVALTEEDRRAILSVCDVLIAAAGRTTLMMALRGSRSQRVLRYAVESTRGYGRYAGEPEADVMARIDALLAEGVLRIEYHDGFPLLGYTERGLQLAMRFTAEEWLETLRAQVQPATSGAVPELPFLMAAMPDRNHDTVFLLIESVAAVADPAWLPLLRAWQGVETRRVQAKLAPIIAALEAR